MFYRLLMKNSILTLLLLVVICAVIVGLAESRRIPKSSPFSIAGVKLGMSYGEVEQKLGKSEYVSDRSRVYSDGLEVIVSFDTEGKVAGVQGTQLELGERDFSPDEQHGELPAGLWEFLGEPDRRTGDGRFAIDYYYDQHNLRMQIGCTGWYFFLGEKR